MQAERLQGAVSAPARQQPKRTHPLILLACAAALSLLLFAQRTVATLPLTATSALVPLAHLGDLLLIGGALLFAHAFGATALRALRLPGNGAEGAAIALTLGLGLWAYGALALGLVGLYRPLVLLGGTLLSALLLRKEIGRSAGDLISWAKACYQQRPVPIRGVPAIILLLGFAGIVALVGALAPPHHWDPLTYHLTSPQHFLLTGRVAPVPGVEFSNTPLTTELLYGIGLAAGSDTFAQLLHLSYAMITAVAIWGLARRFSDQVAAWLAVALFFSTPQVLVWARIANNDLAFGCFVMLMVVAALRAEAPAGRRNEALRWLALAGVFAGLALGTKYQAVYIVATMGVLITLDGWWMHRSTVSGRARLGSALSQAATFGLIAALVGSPWYLKNWLLLDNPIWPTIFGGRGISPLAASSCATSCEIASSARARRSAISSCRSALLLLVTSSNASRSSTRSSCCVRQS